MIGVYILEFDNGYKYIGCSKDIKRRLSRHKSELKAKNKLWYKYTEGVELINITIIECSSKEAARTIELNLIAFSNCKLYNTQH